MSEGRLRYAAIILAAGESKRFGAENKLLHEVKGEPLLRHVVKAFEAADIVVVLGYEGERVEASLAGLSVRTVFNARYAEGMGTSLACGASVLDSERFDAVLISVGDLPGLLVSHVEAVLRAFEAKAGASAIVPCYDGVRGHPVCVPARFLPELSTLSGDEGAKRIFAKSQGGVSFLEMEDSGCIQDLDVSES